MHLLLLFDKLVIEVGLTDEMLILLQLLHLFESFDVHHGLALVVVFLR